MDVRQAGNRWEWEISITTGELQAWLLDGAGGVTGTMTLAKHCGVSDGCWPEWQIIGIGNFDGDGIDDLFWYDTKTGKVDVGMLDGSGGVTGSQWLAKVCGPSDGCSTTWKPAGLADANQDGTSDLLWEDTATGELSAWLLNGTDRILGTQSLSLHCDTATGCQPNALPVGISAEPSSYTVDSRGGGFRNKGTRPGLDG
jgi:hypothetical protein